MKALGRGSVAAFVRGLLEVIRIMLFIAAGLLGVLAIVGLYVYVSGDLSPFPGVTIDELDPWYATLTGFFVASVGVAAMMIVVDRLRRVFATLAAGDPFVPENADHLRVIWITIAVLELLRTVASFVAGFLIRVFDGASDGLSVRFNVEFSVWFAVLVIFVLAEVFREGARMRQEQQLTI